MIKRIIVLFLMVSPLFTFSQNKKTTKILDEQVRPAKKQKAASHKEHQKETEQNKLKSTIPGAKMLPLKLTTSEGATLTENDLPKGQPLLLVLFNPMCDHCQNIAITINKHMNVFKNVSIVFITGVNLDGELKKFMVACGIEKNKHFIVGSVDPEYINKLFMSKGIPQIMIYNKQRLLQKTFFETINIDSTLHYLAR